MAISGWWVAFVGVGVVPIVIVDASWALPVWLGFAVVVGLVDLLLAASPRRIVVTREPQKRTRLGETVGIRVRLANEGRRRLTAVVRDAWPPSAQARPTRRWVSVPAGEARAFTTTLTPFRRGTRHAGAVTIRSFGPIRFWARQATIAAPGAVVVLPPFRARKHLPSRLARLRELDGSTSLLLRGQGSEFDSLREYVRGDDVRSIDWRATARRSTGASSRPAGSLSQPSASTLGAPPSPIDPRLVVRTWRPERDRRVVIVVDSGRAAAARIANETRLDTAYESALLLGALAAAAGDRVDLVIHDRRVRGRVRGANGPDLLASMVDAMADVEPELVDSDWAAVAGVVRGATSQRALVVIATTLDAPGAARSLLAVLPELTRKHLVLIAAVTDPVVVELSRRRERLSDVYLAAAAERALADRERVAAAVRRLGGDLVSATPAELPPAVADRYIEYKRTGRL